MNIIKMVLQIVIITDNMIPKTSLPQLQMVHPKLFFKFPGKIAFDAVHDLGKIRIFFGKLHNPMKMIRHNDVCEQVKRAK